MTATVAAGTATALLSALEDAGGSDRLTLEVVGQATAAQLSDLNNKTFLAIDLSGVTKITGSLADINALYTTSDFVGLGDEAVVVDPTTSISAAQANTLMGRTTGAVTATVDATSATATQLATLADNAARFAGNITKLTLTIPDTGSDKARVQQFVGLTDTQAKALLGKVSSTETVKIEGNTDADWLDLRDFQAAGIKFDIDGKAGDNTIYAGAGSSTVTTAGGADYIELGGGGVDDVDAGAGDDIIAVRSLQATTGSTYKGGLGNDTLRAYGINDLTGSTLTDIEVLQILPGSPGKIIMTIAQVRALKEIKGTIGNSELVIIGDESAPAVTNIDLTGITITNLAKLSLATGLTATLTYPQLAAIGEVSSGPNALTVDLIGEELIGNLDISEANLAPGSQTIHITDLNGFTLTLSQEQAAKARVDGLPTAGNNGTVRIVVKGSSLTSADLGLGDNPATPTLNDTVEAANNTVVVVVNPTSGLLDLNGTGAAAGTALTGVDRYEILAGKTLLITQTEATGASFTGLGTIRVVGPQDFSGVTVEKGVRFEVVSGGTLTLTAAQASERVITGEGSVTVTGLGATPDANLSNIAESIALTVQLSGTGAQTVSADLSTADTLAITSATPGTAYNVTLTGDLDDDLAVTVGKDTKVTLTAAKADKAALAGITGAGTIEITDLEDKPNADLTELGSATTGPNMLVFTNARSVTGLSLPATQFHIVYRDSDGAVNNLYSPVPPLGTIDQRLDQAVSNLNVGGAGRFTAQRVGDDVVVRPIGDVPLQSGRILAGVPNLDTYLTASSTPETLVTTINVRLDTTSTESVTLAANLNTAAGTPKLFVTGSGTVNATGATLDNAVVDVAAGATMILSAGQASNRTVTGGGTVDIVAAVATTPYDFSAIATGLATTLTFTTGGTLPSGTNLGVAGTPGIAGMPGIAGTIDTIRVVEGQTLTLTAAVATGRTITGNVATEGDNGNGGSVVITGLVTNTTYNFAAVTAGVASADGDDAGSVTVQIAAGSNIALNTGTNLGTAVVTIAEDGKLTLSAAQAKDRSITHTGTDTGTVTILGANPGTAYDFSQIDGEGLETKLTFSVTGALNTATSDNWDSIDEVVIPNGVTLTLNAAQASDHPIYGEGSGSIVLVALDDTAFDFSEVFLSGVGTFKSTVDSNLTLHPDALTGTGLQITVNADKTLTLTAEQVNSGGNTVRIDGAGKVVVTGLEAARNADLNVIDSAVDSTVKLSGQGNLEVGATLDTVDKLEITRSSTGTGTFNVTLTAGPAGATLDPNLDITIDRNTKLTLTAEQADASTLGAITGTGTIEITDLEDKLNADLSAHGSAASERNVLVFRGLREALTGGEGTILVSNSSGAYSDVSGDTLEAIAENINSSGLRDVFEAVIVGNDLIIRPGFDLPGLSASFERPGGPTLTASLELETPATTINIRLDSTGGTATTPLALEAKLDTAQGKPTLFISGTGRVNAAGTTPADLANADVVFTGNATLQLSAAQAIGRSITDGSAVGTVVITALHSTLGADLSRIDVDGPVTAAFDGTDTFTGNLGKAVVTVGNTFKMTAAASIVNGKTINGPGTVEVTGPVTANTDLTTIEAPLSFGAGIVVNSGVTLTLTAAQAAGKTITGAGTVLITDNVTADTDLTGIAATVTVSFGTDGITVSQDKTLTLTAAQASAETITGQGKVAVTALNATPAADLSTITVEGTKTATVSDDVTFTGNLGTFTTTVIADKTLKAAADKVSGKTIIGDGTVEITGNVTADTSLTGIAATVTVSFGSDGITVSENKTLTLTAAQAAGKTINGTGTVVVSSTELAGENFSSIAANLDLQAVNDGAGTNPTLPTLAAGQVLTLSAYLADERSVTGAGTVVVLGDMAAVTADLDAIATDLDISDATGTPTSLPTLVENQDLRMTAAQADSFGNKIDPYSAGTVTVELATISADPFNFSMIPPAVAVTAEFGSAGLLNSDTNMSGVNNVVLFTGVTELTGEQANGISFSGDEGTVNITASDGAQSLKGTTGNDVIFGDMATGSTDTVDISQGGSDRLVFSGAANDFTVTGFTASGDGADKFDFSSVSGSLVNANAGANAEVVQVITPDTVQFITGEILLFTRGGANTAEGVESDFSNDLLGTPLNERLAAGTNDMIFVMANDNNTNVNIWRWTDSGGNGDVEATELTLLATLNGLTRTDIEALNSSNFTL